MAVISIVESWDREASQDRTWQRTYRRKWLVQTNSAYDGPVTIRASLPVQIGNSYLLRNHAGVIVEHDFGSFVNSITLRCVSRDGCNWEAILDYSPYNPSIFPVNPLNWPIKVSWGTTKFERSCQYDNKGKAIVNSAGQYFDPAIVIDDSRMNLKIERAEATFDPSIADQFKDAISSDMFFQQQPGTWKVADITGDLIYNVDSGTADGFYYQVTYMFEFRSEGWKTKVLDQGLMVLNSSNKLVSAKDGDNAPVTSPIPLDGKGKALASGAELVFLEFDAYDEIAFSQLNLDPTGAPGQG